jgi:anti-sigma-K factor RskA
MDEDDRNVLAGEYVLGLLEPEERVSADALRASDSAFAFAVLSWEFRLVPLVDELPEVAPPASVWPRIEAAIRPKVPRRFWRPFGFSLAGLAVAGLAAVFVLRGHNQPAPGQEIAALTSNLGGSFVVDKTATGLQVAEQNVPLPAGKVAELWVIAPGQNPQALGLLDPARVVTTKLPPAGVAGLVLAVSVEPPGGSPTGLPTGPVIAEGTIAKL